MEGEGGFKEFSCEAMLGFYEVVSRVRTLCLGCFGVGVVGFFVFVYRVFVGL